MVIKNALKVSFSLKAKADLRSIFDYVKHKSESTEIAHYVRKTILLLAKKLEISPEKYQIDEYYDNAKVRRYFVWDYRIVFEIFESEVVVLRIYNINQSPSFFRK